MDRESSESRVCQLFVQTEAKKLSKNCKIFVSNDERKAYNNAEAQF